MNTQVNSQSTSVPKKMRIRRGDWDAIRIEYNAEYCENRSIEALRVGWSRNETKLIEFVTGFYRRKNAEIKRILDEAREAGIMMREPL